MVTENWRWNKIEGKASIQIGHVNDKDKQKVSLTYYVGPFDNVEEAQSAKLALDKIAEAYGAEIHDEARIIGDAEHREAAATAQVKTEQTEESTE